jgi:hypothetical protein
MFEGEKMQRDDGLAARVSQMYTVFSTGDASVVNDIISSEADILGVGTDPNEWWIAADMRRAFEAQVPEMHAAGLHFHPGNIQAYSEGSIGWVADQPTLAMPDGNGVPMRLTSVWRQEAGTWKMVQFHLSIGVPNQEALGEELTT